MNGPTPFLSVVASTRNDDDRIVRQARCFASSFLEQADRHGLAGEIVLVEWNPPPDRAPLAQALDASDPRVRIIRVPAEIHARFPNSDRLPFFQMTAKNAGIRRAKGKFVLATNVDILLSEKAAAFLASGLREGRMYRADRLDVPEEAVECRTTAERLAFCRSRVLRANRKEGFLHTNACGDFTLMAKRHWEELHGYPEMPVRAMKLDGLLCYAAHAAGARETVLRDPVYHIDHPPRFDGAAAALAERAAGGGIPQLDGALYKEWTEAMRRDKRPMIFNGPDWGLAGDALPEFAFQGAGR